MGPGDKVRRSSAVFKLGLCQPKNPTVDGVKVTDYSHIYYSQKWGVTVVVDVLSLDRKLTSHHLLMSLEIALTLTGYCA